MSSLEYRCPPRQAVSSTKRHRSVTPFHALFSPIAARTDISPAAKLLYAALVSVHRMTKAPAPTQAEIGAMIGLSRHQVWRAQCELVAAGLLTVYRNGQGLPNSYALSGVNQADLDGSAGAGHQGARPFPSASQSWSGRREERRKMIDSGPDHSGYDVSAWLARERATYQEAGARYTVR